MATTHKRHRTDSVRQLLRESTTPVRYDVARGLARHEELVAGATPLPEWASELTLPVQARRVRAFARRSWWLGGTLLVAGMLWLAAGSYRRAEQMQRSTQTSATTTREGTLARSPGASLSPSMHRAAHTTERHADSALVAQPIERALGAGESAPLVDAPAVVSGAREASPAVREPGSSPTETNAAASFSDGDATADTSARAEHRAPSRPVEVARMQTSATTQTVLPRQGASAARQHHDSTRARPKASARTAVETPRDAEEMRQLSEAERLLAPDPVRALRLAREGQLEFRGGYFTQERRYIEVMALFALGRHDEAHAVATWFVHDYPRGPYRHRVETEMLRFPVH